MADTFAVQLPIKGIEPLLMCAFPPEDVEEFLIRGKRPPKLTDINLEDIARARLYTARMVTLGLEDDDTIVVPKNCVFACLRDAGKLVKYDARRSITDSAKATKLPSIMRIHEQYYALDHKGWVRDTRPGRLKDGTAVGITRPMFLTWGFTLPLTITLKGAITMATIKQLFEEAGTVCGLMAFRPSCGGEFGQFLADWENAKIVKA